MFSFLPSLKYSSTGRFLIQPGFRPSAQISQPVLFECSLAKDNGAYLIKIDFIEVIVLPIQVLRDVL